jgi:COMPASS component SPP1
MAELTEAALPVNGETAKHTLQNGSMSESYKPDEPVMAQSRQTPPKPLAPHTTTSATSPSAIKSEEPVSPIDDVPMAQANDAEADRTSVRAASATPNADTAAKHVTDLRDEVERSMKAPSTEASTPTSTVTPKPTTKKRATPKSAKKGTASTIKKPTNKKRKLDSDHDGQDTPTSKRSLTPVSSVTSKATPRKGRGASKTAASTSKDDEDSNASGDDGEVFCICRKPDDHKWMIGCDGGCEDWFHGACVNIKEVDGDLIDRYICEYSLFWDKKNVFQES